MTPNTGAFQVCVIPGSQAFSEFRSQALAVDIGAKDVSGQWYHYVELLSPLRPDDRSVLEQLLAYGGPLVSDESDNATAPTLRTFYVLPRPGTISPWSSKATSIAQVCGLKNVVKRIERG